MVELQSENFSFRFRSLFPYLWTIDTEQTVAYIAYAEVKWNLYAANDTDPENMYNTQAG